MVVSAVFRPDLSKESTFQSKHSQHMDFIDFLFLDVSDGDFNDTKTFVDRNNNILQKSIEDLDSSIYHFVSEEIQKFEDFYDLAEENLSSNTNNDLNNISEPHLDSFIEDEKSLEILSKSPPPKKREHAIDVSAIGLVDSSLGYNVCSHSSVTIDNDFNQSHFTSSEEIGIDFTEHNNSDLTVKRGKSEKDNTLLISDSRRHSEFGKEHELNWSEKSENNSVEYANLSENAKTDNQSFNSNDNNSSSFSKPEFEFFQKIEKTHSKKHQPAYNEKLEICDERGFIQRNIQDKMSENIEQQLDNGKILIDQVCNVFHENKITKDGILFSVEPKGLGELFIQLKIEDNTSSIEIFSDSDEVIRLLENSSAILESAIESTGLEVDLVSFSLEDVDVLSKRKTKNSSKPVYSQRAHNKPNLDIFL